MLARKFDWANDELTYKKISEEKDIENLGKGKWTFECVSMDGKKFRGQAFETTVAAMCDFEYWKLKIMPSKKDPTKNFAAVVKADYPPKTKGGK
jgi:hypothetical protein